MYPNMLELRLECEEAMLVPEGDPFLCLSVDASKCFDRIRPTQALELAARHGLDPRTLRGIASFNLQLQRRFSCATVLDTVGLTPTNGLLQGDPMSVLLCNLCIQDWHRAVTKENPHAEAPSDVLPSPTTVKTCAFIDDRTLVTTSYASMQQAWQNGVAWDAATSWKVNADKTHMLAVRAPNREPIGSGMSIIKEVQQLCILGHEITKAYAASGRTQKNRTQRARTSARRLSQLSLCPAVSQRVLAAAVLPKFAFGLQHRPISKQAVGSLKTALRQALGLYRKANAWEALCMFVFPGHQIDPEIKGFYTHALTLTQALREGLRMLSDLWTRVWNLQGPCIPKGPAGMLREYFRRLSIQMNPEGLSWSCEGTALIHVINSPLKAIGHFLRQAARLEWTRQLQDKRQNMDGILNLDLGLTAAISRKEGHVLRRFLILVLTDAIWTMARRARCGLSEDPHCPWCPSIPEKLLHLWFDCPK